MTGWLTGTRVVHNGRSGVVICYHATDPCPHPIVQWDHGTPTSINANKLTRAGDDWATQAVNNTETM